MHSVLRAGRVLFRCCGMCTKSRGGPLMYLYLMLYHQEQVSMYSKVLQYWVECAS